ncbi:hypothetical protein M4S82_15690 [Planococcus sp. MERTA32b]|nr:hypothetical protein [Planococcus sp. MER TA 32b]
MTKNKINIWFLSAYTLALTSLLYFGLNSLVINAIGDTFPNIKFLTVLVLMIVIAWSMGLGVRHYLNSFTKDLRNKFKNSFLATTLMSWIIVLVLFTVT